MESVPTEVLRDAKRMGFSDGRLAAVWRLSGKGAPEKVRHFRKKHGVTPVYKRVDTCAAEFESYTPYLYSTYEEEDEAAPTPTKKVIILGSGPNRIGQGIEFDYCCCHATFALRDDGYETIMINCNPETVSTDYDTSDRLYFEPLTLEDVFAIYEHEASGGAPVGVIVQFGGQTPLNLALPLKAAGVNIIGTSPESIDLAEDRKRFGKLLEELEIPQAPGAMATSLEEAVEGAKRIGYPVLVRPSYVLGGRAMVIAYDEETVTRYMKEAVEYSQDRPVLIDHFLEDAIEVDVDALSDGEDVVIGGIMQHIEEAGIHSGDSSCVLPAVDIPEPLLERMRDYTFKLARALKVIGLMNIQFAIPRTSKRIERQWRRWRQGLRHRSQSARLAHRALRFESHRRPDGEDRLAPHDRTQAPRISPRKHRAQHRSRYRPLLLREVPGLPLEQVPRRRHRPRPGDEVHRRSHGRGRQLRRSLRQGADRRRTKTADARHRSSSASPTTTSRTSPMSPANSWTWDSNWSPPPAPPTSSKTPACNVERVYKVKEGRPNVVDLIKGERIQLIINTPHGADPLFDEKAIRRAAVTARIPTITTISAARAAAEGIAALQRGEVSVQALQHLHAERITGKRR